MLFSLLKHYLDLYISDTALKVSRSLYCFTSSTSHFVENYFPRLWGTAISDAIFNIIHFFVYKKSDDGVPFVQLLQQNNIIPGIKVDKGVVPLAGSYDECTTQGKYV